MGTTLLFAFEMLTRAHAFHGGSSAPDAIVPVPVDHPGEAPRLTREEMRQAETEATLSDLLRLALLNDLIVSRVRRPDCACEAPQRGASGCCGFCGGSNFQPSRVPASVSCAPAAAPVASGEMTSNVEIREALRWGLEALGMPEVRIDLQWKARFTRRMGDALVTGPSSGRIRLSSPLWSRATPQERRQTVLHELAHITADLRHKQRCSHGYPWKAEMRRMGLEPKRCHNVNRDGLRRRRR